MSRYAFYFDSSGCSGCKACQVACKDRNGLEVGLLWRRVYEVSGGSWERQGEAWQPQVFAYNLSVACNHCERAVCAEACPTQAIRQREDGIVLIEAQRCIGCKYCSWACPYGAPQYDWRSKNMTKYTFCVEDVEAGLAPACVAACPLRVLEFGDQAEMEKGQAVRSVAPLPEAEMTGPALFIQPHRDAGLAEQPPGRVANQEEVHTGKKTSELPLVIFSILAQMAAGAFIVLGAFTGWSASQVGGLDKARIFTFTPLLATGLVFAIGVLASLLHLGHPLRAYRALFHLRTSWLSREILLVGLFFGAGWAVFCGLEIWLPAFTGLLWLVYGLTALAGLALIFCMARVYQLESMPAWRSWLTPVSFYLTAGLLGVLFSAALLAPGLRQGLILLLQVSDDSLHTLITSGATVGLLLLALDLGLQDRRGVDQEHAFWLAQLRLALTVAAMLPLGIVLAGARTGMFPSLMALAFGLALGAQIISRWQFYGRLDERDL
jgi:anaerobic dimethyl sulfoxide reductase subunit B (iron-sulfur subunit)